MMRLPFLAVLASAAVVLSLTTGALGSSGGHRATLAAPTYSGVSGLDSPFASGSGTCNPTDHYATFQFPVFADHPNPIAELTTSDRGFLETYYTGVDTGGAGTVWAPYGTSLLPGDYGDVQIYCDGDASSVSYSVALYDSPATPFTLSGAVTSCPTCGSRNIIQFSAPGTAHYLAELTLTQGGVALCCDGTGHDQVFASSGTLDLGYVQRGVKTIELRPLAGPTADWSLSVHALPVILSRLKFNVSSIRPRQITTIGYRVDGDVTLSAVIENSAGNAVSTVASQLPVLAGDRTLTWNGLNQAGSPVPNGTYTLAVSVTDAAGNSGSGQAAIRVASCQVPRVTGRGLTKAKHAIIGAGCSVGAISRIASSKRLKGHVLSQKPRPGSLLKKGARVNLSVGAGLGH